MSLQEQVKNAENPKVALEAVARFLDTLNTKIDQTLKYTHPAAPPNVWGQWEVDHADELAVVEVDRLKQQLSETTDPDEKRALIAQIELASDTGTVHDEPERLPEGNRVTVTDDGSGNVVVDLPAPSARQEETREIFAEQVLKPHYGWSEDQVETFRRGGPLLLYYSDREMLTELPTLWLREFVNDIQENSPQEAHEFARDMLKESAPDTQDLTIENLTRDLENLNG